MEVVCPVCRLYCREERKTTLPALEESEKALEGSFAWTHYHMMMTWTASVVYFDSTEQEHILNSWKEQGTGRILASRLPLATLGLGQVTSRTTKDVCTVYPHNLFFD